METKIMDFGQPMRPTKVIDLRLPPWAGQGEK
jgi:hypothetical protein